MYPENMIRVVKVQHHKFINMIPKEIKQKQDRKCTCNVTFQECSDISNRCFFLYLGFTRVVRAPGYRKEMYCVSYQVRTEFIYVM
jgi:hypothetical protein